MVAVASNEFDAMIASTVEDHKNKNLKELARLFEIVTASGFNLSDSCTTTPLFKWLCGFIDYQNLLVQILNQCDVTLHDIRPEVFQRRGYPGLRATSSHQTLARIHQLLHRHHHRPSPTSSTTTETSAGSPRNLDIRNHQGNSSLSFACENGQTKSVQLLLKFLDDEGLNHANDAGTTPRVLARIQGHEWIAEILTDEMITETATSFLTPFYTL